MLCRDTGKIVHIDFGDCFEVAMMREKYPEKVPFRLTRMLIAAMEVGNPDIATASMTISPLPRLGIGSPGPCLQRAAVMRTRKRTHNSHNGLIVTAACLTTCSTRWTCVIHTDFDYMLVPRPNMHRLRSRHGNTLLRRQPKVGVKEGLCVPTNLILHLSQDACRAYLYARGRCMGSLIDHFSWNSQLLSSSPSPCSFPNPFPPPPTSLRGLFLNTVTIIVFLIFRSPA